MGLVRQVAVVGLPAAAAETLWTDVRRWPTFVEGFARVQRVDPDWPAPGSKVVWESIPGGRGQVTERVVEHESGRFAVEVYEEALSGRQTLTFEPDEEHGTLVTLELDYGLTRAGPLRALADVLFIRRALSDALARTLRRFATEAAEEAAAL